MLKEREGMMPAIVLTIVCVITGLLLAFTNNVTKDKIALAEQNAAMEQMRALLPEASEFTALTEEELTELTEGENIKGLTSVFEAKADGEMKGYVFTAETKGYGGMLPLMLAVRNDGTISGMSIMTNEETPGLGKKVESPDFTNQFNEKPADKNFNYRDPSDSQQKMDAVTGATISSASVMSSVNKALKAYRALVQ